MSKYPILVVDDEEMTINAMKTALRSAGYRQVEAALSGQEALEAIKEKQFSLITLDLNLPDVMGLELLPEIYSLQPDIQVIVVSGMNEIELAVKCIREGASDYLTKPVEKARLITSIQNALNTFELAEENKRLRDSLLSNKLKNPEYFENIVTNDSVMLSIFKYIEAVAPTSLPVLINGETGTGKELLAKAVHDASGRKGNFIPVNVAGLDDSLFSDTIFGHKKGAFTGAVSDREGMLNKAAEGTLFLDEIGDLSLESQIKLLRLLQEQEYYPLGSDKSLRSNARLVFAANRPLEALVKERSFRPDLFYRLRSHSVELPPLRKRQDDIPPLIDYLIREASKELNKKDLIVQDGVYNAIKRYTFPGNIRELRGLIFDAVLRAEDNKITTIDLNTSVINIDSANSLSNCENFKESLSSIERLPTLQEASEAIVDTAMERCNGNISAAAELIGLTRSALSKRLSRRE